MPCLKSRLTIECEKGMSGVRFLLPLGWIAEQSAANVDSKMTLPLPLNNSIRPALFFKTLAVLILTGILGADYAAAQTIVYRGVAFTGKRYKDGTGTENLGSFGPPVISDRGDVSYRSIVYGQGIDSFRDDRIISQTRRRPRSMAAELQILTTGQKDFGVAGKSLEQGALDAHVPESTGDTVNVPISATAFANISTSFNNFLAVNREGSVGFTAGLFVQGTVTYDSTTINSSGASVTERINNPYDDNFSTLYIATPNGSFVAAVGANQDYDPSRFTAFDVPFGLYSQNRGAVTGSSAGSRDVEIVGNGTVSGLYFGNIFRMDLIGRTGTSAAGLPINATYSSFSLPGVNNAGVASSNVDVNSTPNVFSGIYNIGTAGRPGFFLGTGTVAPGTEGTFSGITSSPWLASRGNLAFSATIADDDVITSGIFVGRVRNDELNLSGGSVQLLVSAGSTSLAPMDGKFNNSAGESTDAVFASFEQPGINNRGTVAFLATVTGTNIDTTNDTGLWVVPAGTDNETRTAKIVVRTGDLLYVDGVQKEVVSVGFNPYYGLNNRNELVFSVSFADATSGVIRAIVR